MGLSNVLALSWNLELKREKGSLAGRTRDIGKSVKWT